MSVIFLGGRILRPSRIVQDVKGGLSKRGVDMMNAGYHYLDLVPKGRDEKDLQRPQAWVRHRDNYGET